MNKKYTALITEGRIGKRQAAYQNSVQHYTFSTEKKIILWVLMLICSKENSISRNFNGIHSNWLFAVQHKKDKISFVASPANKEKLAIQCLPSHGHQNVANSHALTEAHNHSGFGQVSPQPLQQPVKALLSSIAPDFAWEIV